MALDTQFAAFRAAEEKAKEKRARVSGQPVARTAYAQHLQQLQSGEDPTGSSIPSYMVASDTLNIANQNKTFIESAFDTMDSIPKFIGASVISGANQLYNIPADVGNLFGGDFERSDTAEVMEAVDSDLGTFYQEHQQGVDLVGFMVSSLVPGTAGMKVLNAGQKSLRVAIQSGRFGTNTGKALGLLTPRAAPHLRKALKEVATNSGAATIASTNALKAIAAGAGQGTLEVLAFETAVSATLFNSPILENQSFGDFVTNIAFGAGVFGLAGGAVNATKLSFALKNTADKAAIKARPWTSVGDHPGAALAHEKIAIDFERLNNIPPIPTNVSSDRQAFLKAAADSTRATLNNRIRTEVGNLAGGDQSIAEPLYQAFKASNLNSQHSAMIGMVEISKVGGVAKIADKAEKLAGKVALQKASIKEIDEYSETFIEVSYAKLWGEGVGIVTPKKPVITSLSDSIGKGQSIKVAANGVKAGNHKFPFNLNFNKGMKAGRGKDKKVPPAWDILKSNPLQAQARYAWASKLKAFELTEKTPLTIHVNDMPLMEKLFIDSIARPEQLAHVRYAGLEAGETVGAGVAGLREFIGNRKVLLANKLLDVPTPKGKVPFVQDEIAAIINTKSSFLSGDVLIDSTSNYHLKDILAMQDHAETYTKQLVKRGLRREEDGIIDIWNVPQHARITYDSSQFAGINNHVIENMATIKGNQKLYQDDGARAAAAALGEDFFKLEEINSSRVFSGAVPSGATPGLAASATSNYGGLAATVQNIGNITTRVIAKFKDSTRSTLEPLLYKLGTKQEAAIEWSTLNSKIRAIEGNYGLNEAGDALEPLVLLRWKTAAREAAEAGTKIPKRPVLKAGNPERVDLINKEVRELAKAHIELNAGRTNKLAGIRSAQGNRFNRDPEAFYPIPINPNDYPHFALVVDDSITSGNHTKTLFASTSKELESMSAKLKENPHLRILFKDDAEEYYKSIGQYDYEKTINNSYLDIEAHRKGVSAPFIVSTDPQKVTSDMLTWHLQRETGLVREAVSAKYEVQFRELQNLGREMTKADRSKFGGVKARLGIPEAVDNPFKGYIDTALGIRPTENYPWWTWTNTMADEAVSRVLKRATDVMEKAKSPDELLAIDTMLKKAGYKGAHYTPDMEIFANAEPARGALTTAVRKANSILATIVLRLDPLNAVNNAVSANVLLGAETKAVFRAVNRGDAEAVGALAKLTKIKVPGTEDAILAPRKLIANSVAKFGRVGRDSDEFRFFKENGFMTNISDQYRNTLDDLAFTGKETVGSFDSRINKVHKGLVDLANKGEQWTGNRLAEEFNRFVAADVMKQMTDVAVTRNLMTAQEQLAYINIFVNRTQGNYLAAQRPMMFQGPIGQSIGLFQTYQFNLMQQLLRHVGEGHAKDAMTLLALQGTIHGMNGLPAFNAVNTHLVGTASGNKEHRDAYSELYGIVGREAGDWLMYGVASNALGLIDPDLKINLYTRGDINPRHVTIVPVDPASVPIVQASAKVFGNLLNTAKKLAAGGDVSTTLLQGLEHNSISRPLAGLAQTMQGMNNPLEASYSTSKRGNVVASNDLLSLANLGRIVGGKPLGEAIALDTTYRIKAYTLRDSRRRTLLGQAIKTTMIAGQEPTKEQMDDFILDYAKAGGRQEEFNGWATQLYKTANLSQANKIQQNLDSPFSKSVQEIMGGLELRDFQ